MKNTQRQKNNQKLTIKILLSTQEGRDLVKEKLFLTDAEVAQLALIAPAFDLIARGVPDAKAFADVLNGSTMRYYKFAELKNKGQQLEVEGREEEDLFAVALYRIWLKSKQQYISSLVNVVYDEAVDRKNWKAASQLLQMSVNEFKKNYIIDEDNGVVKGAGELKIEFVGSEKQEEERLSAIDEQIKKDLE